MIGLSLHCKDRHTIWAVLGDTVRSRSDSKERPPKTALKRLSGVQVTPTHNERLSSTARQAVFSRLKNTLNERIIGMMKKAAV